MIPEGNPEHLGRFSLMPIRCGPDRRDRFDGSLAGIRFGDKKQGDRCQYGENETFERRKSVVHGGTLPQNDAPKTAKTSDSGAFDRLILKKMTVVGSSSRKNGEENRNG